MKPGACGSRRATTSKPMRNATRPRSIHRSARALLAASRSGPFVRSSVHSTRDDGFLWPEWPLAAAAFDPAGNDSGSWIEPSVSAAGPGCRISVDLTSRSQPVATAGTSTKPGRAATFAGTNFLPHQEPIMMSGGRDHSPGRRCGPWHSCAQQAPEKHRRRRRPRSTRTPSARPEIIGSSHSSK